jgi:large subunit ribosomal protein L29
LRNKTPEELRALLVELRREQFNLRVQQASRQLTNPARFGAVRREVARVHTLLTEIGMLESRS